MGSWRGGKNRHAEQETQEAAASESGSWKIRLCRKKKMQKHAVFKGEFGKYYFFRHDPDDRSISKWYKMRHDPYALSKDAKQKRTRLPGFDALFFS
jgi:hypothetical protein